MENIELFSNFIKHNSPESIENNLKACLGDHVFCFITSKQLCIAEDLHHLKIIETTDFIKDTVIDLKYLNFWQYIFIATETTLVIVDPKFDKGITLDSPTNKIKCVSWNPNETCLVILDEQENLFGLHFQVINADLQQYNFVPLKPIHLKDNVPNSVYVGWGSHNSQFKGMKKVEEKITEQPQEYSEPKISWRGNGEQFVVNFWQENRRFLKVFDNNLNPLYQSEVYANLLPPISFKGQGNFIACAAEHNDINKMVIFEKNCRVKSEFVIKHVKGKIHSLQYHPNLHILAIYSEDVEKCGFLSIYLYSNGHWYLKQQLKYPKANQLLGFHWTNCCDNICNLNVLTTEGLQQLVLKLVFNMSLKTGLVAAIDGDSVNFTRISEEIIPPPMSSFNLSFTEVVNRVIYDDTVNLYTFVLADNSFKKYVFEDRQLRECFENMNSEAVCNLSLKKKTESIAISSSEVIVNNKLHKFMLDENKNLFLENNVLCHKVLSVIVLDKYLIFTHASSKLYCVRLNVKNISMIKWDLRKCYSRDVEQGSKILGVTNNSEIVLILPRGNLETITCRLIAVDIIEQLLDANKWEVAIKELRRQRLNWNLLIDLNPKRFCNHLDEFIEAASTVSILNQIVSEFSTENCLKTIYLQCIENDYFESDIDKKDIYLKILNKIISLNPVSNLVSIVMLQVRHFTLNAALRSICQVFKMGQIDMCKIAISQILLHCHSQEVINEAYTLYNLDFMTFVYNSCSEDPMVFEPKIECLRILEPLELRFKMNELGKHYASATKYLIRCTHYTDQFVTNFITKHLTQYIAYESVSPKHLNFKLISELFATFLSMRSRHNEAGMVLERAGLLQEAIIHYQRALNWQQVLSLVDKLKVSDRFRKDVFLNIAENLIKKKRLEEAVVLYEYYCNEMQKAVELLTQERRFQQALALSGKYNYIYLEENLIIPAIIQYRADILDKITENGNKFIEYSSRLYSLRQKKINNFKYRGFEGEGTLLNEDLHSEYGSIISRDSSFRSSTSGGTTLSLRNRRKHEKKRLDLREGGIYEDIALIRQLYLLSIDIFSSGEEVKEVCSILTDNQSFTEAKLLHKLLSDAQENVKVNIPKIWNETFLNAEESSEPEILGVIQNREELDMIYRNPPSTEIISDWKMLIFYNK